MNLDGIKQRNQQGGIEERKNKDIGLISIG